MRLFITFVITKVISSSPAKLFILLLVGSLIFKYWKNFEPDFWFMSQGKSSLGSGAKIIEAGTNQSACSTSLSKNLFTV